MYFVIHTEDKATKARVGKHIVYNVDWLKEHFETERKLYEKKRKWIKRKGETIILYGWYQCSQCGAIIGEPTNYCSECGARMEVDG